jgi:hypothetical protein
MMQDTEPVPDAIKRLSDQWRAQRTANPPSLMQQWKDDPVLYRRACEEARQRAKSSPLFQTLDLIRYFER